MTPDRPHAADWDAWRGLVAALQAQARAETSGTAIITIRLAVRDGLLIAWSAPRPERWNQCEDDWLGRQGLKAY